MITDCPAFRVETAVGIYFWTAMVNGMSLCWMTPDADLDLTARGIPHDDHFRAELVDQHGNVIVYQVQVYLPRPVGLPTPTVEELEELVGDWSDEVDSEVSDG